MANLPEGQCPTQPAAGPPPTRTTNLQASLDSVDPLHSPILVFLLKLNCTSEMPNSNLVPPRYRLYEGVLVHRFAQLMTPGNVKNLLKQNESIEEGYEIMLAIVRQFDCQQPRRGREAQKKHPQGATDWEQLFEPEEEAAANRALSGLDLDQTVSLRMRFMRNRRQWIWNKNMSDSNPMVVLKHDRRGGQNDV